MFNYYVCEYTTPNKKFSSQAHKFWLCRAYQII